MSSLFEMTDQERDSVVIMHDLNKTLINAIYSASKTQGISQKEIADRLNVNKSVINRLLQGRGNPTFRTVAQICAVIGIKPQMSYSLNRVEGNIGRAIQGRDADPSATSHTPSAAPKSFSSTLKKSDIGVTTNV